MLASARGAEREREGEGGKKRGRGRSEGGDQACSKYRRTTFIFCALIIHLAPALVRLFLPRSQIKAEMDAPRRNRDPPRPPLPPCETSRTAIGRLLHRENRPTIPPSPPFSRIYHISMFFETFLSREKVFFSVFWEILPLLVSIEGGRGRVEREEGRLVGLL